MGSETGQQSQKRITINSYSHPLKNYLTKTCDMIMKERSVADIRQKNHVHRWTAQHITERAREAISISHRKTEAKSCKLQPGWKREDGCGQRAAGFRFIKISGPFFKRKKTNSIKTN
jgi:hypothetical protein